MMDDLKLIDTQDVAALASPLRRKLLSAMGEPVSAAALARRFEMSRQRVGYHMRELERQGFIEAVEERQVRGCTERLFRARALTWMLDPAALDQPERASSLGDRYSWSTLMDLAGRMLKDLTRLRRGADAENKRLATLSMETEIAFSDPAARQAFTEELVDTVNALVARHDRSSEPESRRFRLVLGAYPTPKEPRENDHE